MELVFRVKEPKGRRAVKRRRKGVEAEDEMEGKREERIDEKIDKKIEEEYEEEYEEDGDF